MAKHSAAFKDTNTRCFAAHVRAQRFQKARQQRGPHHVEMRGNRIQYAYRPIVLGCIGREQQLSFRRDESERDHFLPIARNQS